MKKQDEVRLVHLRRRNNGVPQEHGGYTVAIKARSKDAFNVTLCQCNNKQRYDEKLGGKVAKERMGRGQFFVQGWDEMVVTLNQLHHKLCDGHLHARLNIDSIMDLKPAAPPIQEGDTPPPIQQAA